MHAAGFSYGSTDSTHLSDSNTWALIVCGSFTGGLEHSPALPPNLSVNCFKELPKLYCAQRAGHASLPGPTASLVTELLQLPVPGYGSLPPHLRDAVLPYSRLWLSLKIFLFR